MWLCVTGTLSRSIMMLPVRWRITLMSWLATFPSKMSRRAPLSNLSPLRPSFLVKLGDRTSDGTDDIYEAWHRDLGHAEHVPA